MKSYKYAIHETVNDLLITSRIRDSDGKKYSFICQNCGYDSVNDSYYFNGVQKKGYYKREGDFKKGCPVCAKKFIVERINSIAKTRQELVKFFMYEEDAKKYSANSAKKVWLKCPDCGMVSSTKIKIYNMTRANGYRCECRDSLPYSEKYMLGLLRSIKSYYLNMDYIYQATKKDYCWMKESRYDFLIKYGAETIIIETHGSPHYKKSFKNQDLKKTKKNDYEKRKNAIENGQIKVNNYIELNCSISSPRFIRNNIEKSELARIFHINEEMFNDAQEFAVTNLHREILNYFIANKGVCLKDIGNQFGLSVPTVSKILLRMADLGLCNYKKLEQTYYSEKTKKHVNQIISCYSLKTGEITEYSAVDDILRVLPNLTKKEILRCCSCDRIKSHGYIFFYESIDDSTSKFRKTVQMYNDGIEEYTILQEMEITKDKYHNLIEKAAIMGMCSSCNKTSPNKGRRGFIYCNIVKKVNGPMPSTIQEIMLEFDITRANVNAHIQMARERGNVEGFWSFPRKQWDVTRTKRIISSCIINYMKEKSMSKKTFAEKINITKSALIKIIEEKNLPNPDLVIIIARVVNKAPSELVCICLN